MPKFQTGVVSDIGEVRGGLLRVGVKLGRKKKSAVAFVDFTGPLEVGDRVVLNTTATDLALGTGGDDFVLWNLGSETAGKTGKGHILKMRYTPWQIDTLVAEAPESPHHEALRAAYSLDGTPVVACGLHSQIPAVAAMLKSRDPDLRVVYLMTDGGALPMGHSHTVDQLRHKGLIDATVTCGHAFGGDLESVNVFSGLIAASEALSADVTIVSIGPGIVGTDSLLGHTGMDQGQALAAAAALGGRPIAVLRISFADERERHTSVSHHSLTALRFGTPGRVTVAVPDLEITKLTRVMEDLIEAGVAEMHDLRIVDSWETEEALKRFDLEPTTMGRGFGEDPSFFEAAGAAGILAGDLIYESSEL